MVLFFLVNGRPFADGLFLWAPRLGELDTQALGHIDFYIYFTANAFYAPSYPLLSPLSLTFGKMPCIDFVESSFSRSQPSISRENGDKPVHLRTS